MTAEDKESSVRLQSEVARLSARLEASQRHAHELERELLAGVCMCVCVYGCGRWWPSATWWKCACGSRSLP